MPHLTPRVLKVLVLLGLASLALQPTPSYAQEPEQNGSNPEAVEQEFLSQRWVDVARGRQQPPMLLPWKEGEGWMYSGGPHSMGLVKNGSEGPFSSVDFAPPSSQGCFSGELGKISQEFVITTAPGVIARSAAGEVIVDHDGDGKLSTGWQTLAYHMSDTDRVPVGTRVYPGDRLGRVDCKYGKTTGTHLHLSRTREDVYIPATDEEAPLVLSDWRFGSSGIEYEGWAEHPNQRTIRVSESFTDDFQFISDNGPTRHQEVFGARTEFASLGWVFRIPGTLFKPGPAVEFPEMSGAFVNGRLKGNNGMLLPVASRTLSSTEQDHKDRGSINSWDISAKRGAPIFAAHSGEVQIADCGNAGGYGCWVQIKGDDGTITQYAHMINERSPETTIDGNDKDGDPEGFVMVRVGDIVDQWTVLGRVGDTGKTGWSHVHFVIIENGVHQEVSRYFDANQLEYRWKKGPLEWEWDEVYQESHPQIAPLPLVQRVSPARSRGFMIIFVIVVLLLLGSRFIKGQEPKERFWLLQGLRLGIVQSVAGLVMIFLYLGTYMVVQEGIPFSDLFGSRFARVASAAPIRVQVQPGSLYTPVWGYPCTDGGPGTLGNTCSSEEIIKAAKDWARAVTAHTGTATAPVVVPALSAQFSMDQAMELIQEAHVQGVLVILDTGGDTEMLEKAIRDLTPYGLDGIAVDHEHNESLGFAEIRKLGESFATTRQQAGLNDNGILLVWDVFHRVTGNNGDFSIPGITSVAIMDGFGSISAKRESLGKTMNLFGVNDSQFGVMFFDRRWPVNSSCQNFSNTNGYDCQKWTEAYDNFEPEEKSTLTWLAQQ